MKALAFSRAAREPVVSSSRRTLIGRSTLSETTPRVLLRTLLLMGGFAALGLLAALLPPSGAIAFALGAGAGSFAFLLKRWRDYVVAEVRQNRASIQEAAAMIALCGGGEEPSLPWSDTSLSAKALLRLLTQVQIDRARTIVECGAGVSTLLLARQLRLGGGGHVYALEHDGRWFELMRGWLEERRLTEYATVLHAPLERLELDGGTFSWYSLAAAKPVLDLQGIDLLLVDGPPGTVSARARYPALPLLRSRLAEGALVVLDDGEREDEGAIGRSWSDLLGRRPERLEGVRTQLEWRLGPAR